MTWGRMRGTPSGGFGTPAGMRRLSRTRDKAASGVGGELYLVAGRVGLGEADEQFAFLRHRPPRLRREGAQRGDAKTADLLHALGLPGRRDVAVYQHRRRHAQARQEDRLAHVRRDETGAVLV